MTREEIWEVLEKVDWEKAARMYYSAPYNASLLIWRDGDVTVLESGTHLRSYDDVLVSLRCPGLNNIDTSYFTEGFVEWDDEKEAYISILPGDEGRIVGDLWDVVLECIRDGSVADDLRELAEREALEQLIS
ncbi:MAG: hypothetical protein JRI84_15430 [Deltaproteobacteria bacterium]|nr:hypothetical protein [Deltaproteobacteria bacterium]